MPLKLTNISHPASTNILNTWADSQENTVNNHTLLLQQLQAQVTALKKSQTVK